MTYWKEERLRMMHGKQLEKMQVIVTVYRTIRPKEGDKSEGD